MILPRGRDLEAARAFRWKICTRRNLRLPEIRRTIVPIAIWMSERNWLRRRYDCAVGLPILYTGRPGPGRRGGMAQGSCASALRTGKTAGGAMSEGPSYYTDVETCVEETLRKVGRRIALGTPLGLGKANHLVNEFFRRAREDAKIDLHIFTALTLARPPWKSELERRFLEPLGNGIFGGYPELAYVEPLKPRMVTGEHTRNGVSISSQVVSSTVLSRSRVICAVTTLT